MSLNNGEKHVTNIILSLNRKCNLRCKHCCLNNDFKKNKEYITKDMLEKYFLLIEDWLIKNKDTVSFVTIFMSGAEIGMLPDNVFIDYGNKIYDFFSYLDTKYKTKDLSFGMIILSNFTNLSQNKKEWMLNTWTKSLNEERTLSLTTSYEKGTDRFKKEKHLQIWEDNINFFTKNGAKIVVIWSISKKDALDLNLIINYFKKMNVNVFYVPLLPTGEGKEHKEIILSYDEFGNFLEKMYNTPDIEKLLNNQEMLVNFDKASNFILEQNGFIMIDLLQDLVWNYEKNNEFNLFNDYLNENNKIIYKLPSSINQSKNIMNKLWDDYLAQEKKYLKNMNCYYCPYFNRCSGGISTLRPIYNKPTQCAGFKKTLDKVYKNYE